MCMALTDQPVDGCILKFDTRTYYNLNRQKDSHCQEWHSAVVMNVTKIQKLKGYKFVLCLIKYYAMKTFCA